MFQYWNYFSGYFFDEIVYFINLFCIQRVIMYRFYFNIIVLYMFIIRLIYYVDIVVEGFRYFKLDMFVNVEGQ